jgi:hypothetical protein
VRLRKDLTKHRDGIPRFLFELHPSHKLPKINAKGKPFRSRDLHAMFDQYQKTMTADHDVGLSIQRLYIKINEATHKELEARLPALLHAFQTVADSDIDSATLSEVNDEDQLQLNTPTEPNTFMTSQDNIASTATRTHTCK